MNTILEKVLCDKTTRTGELRLEAARNEFLIWSDE
jgi:hypothetical protein